MNFTLSEDHEALRDSAQSFLSREIDLSKLLVPGATVEQAGYDATWAKVVDLGWPGIVIPEAYGGLGMSYIDLAMIVGEIGRTLAAMPLFGTLAGAWAIEKAGSEAQKALYLGKVAAGEFKLALAVSDTDGDGAEPGTDVKAVAAGSDWRLSGTKAFVVDAAAADALVVAAEDQGQIRYFVVDRNGPGVSVDLVDWRDITRQVCTVTLDGAVGERLDGGAAQDVWPWVRDRLYLVLAAESATGIEKVLDDAVQYAKERVAFGRPIGAFQAIKHQLAELVGLRECAIAGVHYAAWALSEDDARAPLAAAIAQSYASEAYREATHRNIQVFGAIGFTWEMPNHLYYKRARSNAELLGASRHQREGIIRFLEQEQALAA